MSVSGVGLGSDNAASRRTKLRLGGFFGPSVLSLPATIPHSLAKPPRGRWDFLFAHLSWNLELATGAAAGVTKKDDPHRAHALRGGDTGVSGG